MNIILDFSRLLIFNNNFLDIEFEFKLCILEGDKVVRWEEIGKG